MATRTSEADLVVEVTKGTNIILFRTTTIACTNWFNQNVEFPFEGGKYQQDITYNSDYAFNDILEACQYAGFKAEIINR